MNLNSEHPWPTEEHQSPSARVDEHTASDRQDRIPGFSSAKLAQLKVLLIGCGGLNGVTAISLAKKGVGLLELVDPDMVEVNNLSRQMFEKDDLFKPKAFQLARHAARMGALGTVCRGHQVAFDESTCELLGVNAHVVIVGVDNDVTRRLAARVFRDRGTPVIFSGIDGLTSSYGYTFVQEPGLSACLGCVYPHIARGEEHGNPCVPSPAVIDGLLTLSGLTLRALDSLFMDRERHWNLRSIHLGGHPNLIANVEPRSGCELCGAE